MSVRTCVTPGFFDSENRITRIIIPYSPEKFSFEQKHIDKRESGRPTGSLSGGFGCSWHPWVICKHSLITSWVCLKLPLSSLLKRMPCARLGTFQASSDHSPNMKRNIPSPGQSREGAFQAAAPLCSRRAETWP